MKIKSLIASSIILALSACNDTTVSPESGNSPGSVELSGDSLVGSPLTANIADSNGLEAASVIYEWMADGLVISGATASSFVLTSAEVDKMITVTVNYIDNSGYNERVKSPQSDTVEIPATNTPGIITISGIVESGQLLTASLMDDNEFPAADVTYSWLTNGTDSIGANSDVYLLTDNEIGKTITVTATYTDNDAFEESISSAATDIIKEKPTVIPPQVGDIKISGQVLDTELLSVQVSDVNGIDGNVSYQWKADMVDITGATASEYLLTTAELGKVISVNAMYTDGDGAAEDLTAMTTDRVYTTIVKNEAELVAALAVATENNWIALSNPSGGDFDAMAELEIAIDGLVITNTMDSTAEISGATCIQLKGTGTTIDGLTFKDTSSIPSSGCDSSSTSDAMIKMDGEAVIVRNSTFDGYIGTVGYNLIEVKGEDNFIERNVFMGLDSMIDKSGAISIYTDTTDGSKVNTTVQYNLFKDMPTESGDRKSGAYVIQVGRSTGNDATLMNKHKILNNRFDGVEVDERLIKVQSSETIITGNTIVNSTGMISLENGAFSTVSNNVIIPSGTDSDDGGIAFVSMGHTISNNYISNVRTTSGGRGALFTHTDKTDDTSNQTLLSDNAGDLTALISSVMHNTVLNAREGINLDEKSCDASDRPRLNYSSNLIANVTGNDNAASSKGVLSAKFDASGCLTESLTSTNNHIYANEITDGASTAGIIITDASNITGAIDGAGLSAENADGLVSGTGTETGIGADTTKLHLILESEVGPNSTWTAN